MQNSYALPIVIWPKKCTLFVPSSQQQTPQCWHGPKACQGNLWFLQVDEWAQWQSLDWIDFPIFICLAFCRLAKRIAGLRQKSNCLSTYQTCFGNLLSAQLKQFPSNIILPEPADDIAIVFFIVAIVHRTNCPRLRPIAAQFFFPSHRSQEVSYTFCGLSTSKRRSPCSALVVATRTKFQIIC